MMRLALCTAAAVMLLAGTLAAQSTQINLKSEEGLAQVQGQWKWANARIVEVKSTAPDGDPPMTYNLEPQAQKPDFDDSGWAVLQAPDVSKSRGGGHICFVWYRLKLTLPEGVAGKKVRFVTTVDDYGEIWVDGKMPYKEGQSGGTIIAGFNAPNIVELADPHPGKAYQISILGINGPLSVAPTNRIFLRDTYLEITAP